MEAIKKVLQPGKKADDEVLYGDGSNSGQADAGSGAYNAGVPHGENAPQLNTLPEHRGGSGGILSQITNPGGEKYDAQRYGSTATTDASVGNTNDYSSNTGASSGQKEHGVLRQILNPGGEKYDEARYGTVQDATRTGSIPGALEQGSGAQQIQSNDAANESSGRGVLRQLVNPGGDKYDETRYAPTGSVASGTRPPNKPTADDESALSIKSGVLGPYASNTDQSTTGDATDSYSSTANTQGYAHDQSQSHLGRDAALGGAAGLGAGSLGSESRQHQSDYSSTGAPTQSAAQSSYGTNPTATQTGNTNYGASQGAIPSYSTSTSQGATPSYNTSTAQGTSSYKTSSGQSAVPSYTSSSNAPSSIDQSRSHRGEEAAALGTAAAGAGGVAAYEHHKHSQPSSASYGTSQVSPGQQSSFAQQGSAGGLSHHVHNSTTQPDPTTSGRHDIGATSYSTHHSTHDSTHDQTRSHAPTATDLGASAASGTGLSHHVYNGIAGHGSSREPAHHHTTTSASSTADAGLSTGTGAGFGSSTSGYTGSNTQSHQVPGSLSSQDRSSATGYGAAGSGSAAAIAAQEASRRHAQPTSTSSAYSTGASTSDPSYKQDLPDRSAGQTSSGQSGHHYGRDAALAGGAGAAGVGAYEAGKHSGQSGSGPASKTVGPHDSNIANVLDPRVQPQPEYQKQSTTTGPHKSDTLNKLDPRVQSDPSKTSSQQSDSQYSQQERHHTGRDAAAGGAVGAAAGAGLYEADKHHDASRAANTGYGSSNTTQTTTTTSTSSNQPVHDSSLLNKLDPRVKSGTQTDSQDSSQGHSHAGRDAAAVGGAGAATGAGLYEAEKHHDASRAANTSYGSGNNAHTTAQSSNTGSATSQPVHDSNLLNKLDPRVKSDSQTGAQSQSHTGRDAAVAGGAGAATGAGVYEAEKHHGSSHPSSTTQQQFTSTDFASKPANTSQPTTGTQSGNVGSATSQKQSSDPEGAQRSSSGLLWTGPVHASDTLNQLDPRVKPVIANPSGFNSSASGQSQSHTGRDAAVAGGAGAAGAGLYEADKHHQSPKDARAAGQYSEEPGPSDFGGNFVGKTSQGEVGQHGIVGGSVPHHSGSTNTGHQQSQYQDSQRQHHTGRDATLAGGAGAATGAGIYEAEKHHHNTGSDHSSAIGQQTGQSSYGQQGAQGAAPHQSALLNKLDPRVDSSSTSTGAQQSQYQDPSHQQRQHHTGRDAALAGGAGAATGAGAYEAEKHHGVHTAQGHGAATQGYGSSAQGYGTSTGPAPHTIGPHSSDVANVVDPRVQPDPRLQGQDHSGQQHSGLSQDRQHGTSGAATGAAVGAGAGAVAQESHHHEKKHGGPQVQEDEHHHNKLHKEPKEKKEGFLHKLLHPHSKEHDDKHDTSSKHHGHHSEAASATSASGSTGLATSAESTQQNIDPHTGLPVNTSQYGSGVGGTDGSPNVHGVTQDANAHHPDWQGIQKSNTPY